MSRILSIAWYKVLPPKYGGQKGIALFTKSLAQYHELLFLCSKNNEAGINTPYAVKAALPLSPRQFLDPFSWRKIVRTARHFEPDYIILEHPYHGIAAWLACKKTGAKLIVHSHNIEFERFKMLGKWWWRLLRIYEKWVHQKAYLNLFKTERDRSQAVSDFKITPATSWVCPYGIERPVYDKKQSKEIVWQRHHLPAATKLALFAGTLDYVPNAAAVELIFKEIATRLRDNSIRILVCGRNKLHEFQYLKKLNHPNVLYIGEVDDIENYFAAADIFLDTVKTGGGVQSKIIEALSYDLNVVCFREQPGQVSQLAGEKIFAADNNYEEMTANIYRALDSVSSTPAAFFEYYEWKNIISRLNKKLVSIND